MCVFVCLYDILRLSPRGTLHPDRSVFRAIRFTARDMMYTRKSVISIFLVFRFSNFYSKRASRTPHISIAFISEHSRILPAPVRSHCLPSGAANFSDDSPSVSIYLSPWVQIKYNAIHRTRGKLYNT